MGDEITYLARQIEMLMFGKYEQRMTVQELKEKLKTGEVQSYQWIATKEMWADGLTKEMEMADGLRRLLKDGVCDLKNEELNKVVCESEEIRMLNIRNRKKKEEGATERERDRERWK